MRLRSSWPILAAYLLLMIEPAVLKADEARPNIVVILADDLGFSDVGCYGSEIRTPNLDALAAHGLRFRQFYNGARCCPTRAALMTGLYAHQAGVGHMMGDRHRPGYHGDLSRNAVTIAEALRPAGYTTLMAGKWHLTPANGSKHNWPRARGFDRFYGTIEGGGSYFNPVSLVLDDDPIEPDEPGFYYTDAIATHASQFIAEAGREPKPFFLYVAFTSPHWPLHAFETDIESYKGRYDSGWDDLRARRRAKQIAMGLVEERWPLTPRDEAVPPWNEAEHQAWQSRRMEVYAAQVERMDRNIGRIVEALKAAKQLDNTVLLFLADNGGCAEEIRDAWKGPIYPETTRDGRPVQIGNDPSVMPGPATTFQSYGLPWANASNTPFRRYKHWVHEGGIATPLIAHWPAGLRTEPGTFTDQVGHIIDVMATCIDLAGATYPTTFAGQSITPLEGQSLRPIFEGQTRKGHESLFWEHEGNRAVRRGRWKLVARHGSDWELYDLVADRTELHDLAAARPELVRELATLHERWAERCGVVPWDEVTGRTKRTPAPGSGARP